MTHNRKQFSIAIVVGITLAAASAYAVTYEGTLQWVGQWGNVNRDAAESVMALPDGSYLTLGYFEGSFNPAAGATQPKTFGLRDLFVAKFSADGSLQWVKSAGSGHCDYGGGICALPDGSSAIAASYGYGGATITFGYGEANQTNLYPFDRYDVCLARFNADGTLQWARRAGGAGWDSGDHVALAPDGSCYITGSFEMKAWFGTENPPTQVTITAGDGTNGSYDSFCARYSPEGAFAWVKQGNYWDVVAISDGSAVTLLEGGLARYAANGDLLWEDNTLSLGQYVQSLCMVPGTDEFVAVVENWAGGADSMRRYRAETSGALSLLWETLTGPSSMPNSLPGVGIDGATYSYDTSYGVLRRFQPDGTLDWQAYLGIPGYGLTVSPIDGTVLIAGVIYSDTYFGAGQSGSVLLTHWGRGDIFIANYQPTMLYSIYTNCVGEGYIALDPPGGSYAPGTSVRLTAGPWWASRSRFHCWEEDLEGCPDPVASVELNDEDVYVTAVFEMLEDPAPLPAVSLIGICGLALGLVTTGMVAYRRKS